MSGWRFNIGKAMWSLVPFKALEPLVRVLEFGMYKYDRDNWKSGLKKEQILDSLLRHIIALLDGEEYDQDSKVHHIGGILFNAIAYSYYFVKEAILPGTDWVDHLKKTEKIYEKQKNEVRKKQK